MEIHWSPEAAEDLWRVVRHIPRDNFTAARKVADTIYIGVTNLENLPNRGRTGRIDGTRELLFPPLP
jgi:plasmid stabilization system protein ParE